MSYRTCNVCILLAVGVCLLAVAPALAVSIVQPTTVVAQSPLGPGQTINNLINQSGLETTYTSGVTDFDAYTTNLSLSEHNSSFLANRWTSELFETLGDIDFDLGGPHDVSRIAVWLLGGDNNQQPKNFTLLADDDPAFSSPTVVGNYALAKFGIGSTSSVRAQTYTFAATEARYMRMTVTSTQAPGQPFIMMGEVAFGATRIIPLPAAAPAGLALLAVMGLVKRTR